jgi:type IX secretion system substrate protein
MKQLYPSQKERKFISFKHATVTVAFSFITMISFSQGLIFRNPTLASGTAGSDGAVYRFSTVTTNVDALVTINGRSSNLVTLDTVDVTSTGFDKAFQPVVTYNKGNVKGPASWWMEFVITFVQSGTSTPIVQDTLNATAIDVDGDGAVLQEQFTAFGAGTGTYTLNTPTSLSAGSVTNGTMFTGPITNSVGIDTSATKVMVTINYSKVSSIKFRYGAQVTGTGSTSATNRYNSIWFKTFSYTAAKVNTLPVMFSSFTAQLNSSNNKALLNWATTSELNANQFIVQRSTDGSEYEDVAIVFSQEGNSFSLRQYSYSDDISMINSPIVYYRLKLVDMDGYYQYSAIELIRLSKQNSQSGILVYPNPAQSELRITIPDSWQGKSVSYHIYDVHGSLIKQKQSSNAGQTELLNIAELPVGIYIVKAVNGNQSSVQRIVKLNN